MRVKVLFFLLMHGALTVLAQKKQSCLVQGHIKELGNRPIYFSYQEGEGKYVDTVFASNDYFTYQARPSIDSIIHFSIGTISLSYFWYESGIIRINGDAANPKTILVKGTPENEILTQFRQQVDWVYPTRIDVSPVVIANPEREQAIINFIKTYPHYRTSALLLFTLVVFNSDQLSRYQYLYEELGREIQTSQKGKELASLLYKP